jgi:hypothetical protein
VAGKRYLIGVDDDVSSCKTAAALPIPDSGPPSSLVRPSLHRTGNAGIPTHQTVQLPDRMATEDFSLPFLNNLNNPKGGRLFRLFPK